MSRRHHRRALRPEVLEKRELLIATPIVASAEPARALDQSAIEVGELQSIVLREESTNSIRFDDTRIGNIYALNASGRERFASINYRVETGATEHALIGVANLFDYLPGSVEDVSGLEGDSGAVSNEPVPIEIVSATLTLSTKYHLGVGTSVSVHPIATDWLNGTAGKNESSSALHNGTLWQESDFSAEDYRANIGDPAATVSWQAGKNVFDVTRAVTWMYETGTNQGFVVKPNGSPNGQDVDILVSTSEHADIAERPALAIQFRYGGSPSGSDSIGTDDVAPGDVGTDTPAPVPTDSKVLQESLPNPANPAVPLTRYFSEDPSHSTIAHAQSGELTGFSPDGKWQHMLVGLENWHLRNTETGDIQFAHKSYHGGSTHTYFQWTERNTYLRFASVGVVEEVDPATGVVLNTAELTVAPVDDARSLDYADFRLGESSGADGIYLEQRQSYDGGSHQSWFINVLDTSDGQLRERRFFAFDADLHQDDATEDRWRELFFTNNQFHVHLSPFGTPGTGYNEVGGNVYYAFPENGDGDLWRQTSFTSSNEDSVLGESQAHRSLEAIDGLTYMAYSTWRGDFAYLVVADLISGEEIASQQFPRNEVPQHIHFFGNEVTYSLVDVEGIQNLRIETMIVDIARRQFIGPPRVVANSATLATEFIAHARPFGDGQGNYCWHSNEYSLNEATVDLICASTDFHETVAPLQSRFNLFLALSQELGDRATNGGNVLEVLNQINQLLRTDL